MQFEVSIFMGHFQNIHHVKNPSLTIFPLFDGMSFSFENMDGCTIPDNDSPNNPSIVYAETFEDFKSEGSNDENFRVNRNTQFSLTNNHTDEVNIPCSQCEKHFKSPADLFTHFNQIHI